MPVDSAPRSPGLPDKGKTRAQLLSELRELRARAASLEEAESGRRHAEDALRESEEIYRGLFETMQENFSIMEVIYDGQGRPVDYRFLEVNPALERYSGNSRKRLVGLKHSDLMAAGGGAAEKIWFDIICRVGTTGKPEFGEYYSASTGRWAQYYAFSPRPGRCAVISTDITGRKKAEEALRTGERRYRELVENANSIILRSDRDGNITFINGFAQRFFGYSEEEILGRNAVGTIIPAIDSAGRDLATMLEDILQCPEKYRTNVHQNMRKNGELVWVSWTNKAIYGEGGALKELLCVGNDITRLKQAEAELKAAKLQAELYLDLMGHDINNMHQVALGYLELARGLPAGEEQAGFLDKSAEVLQRSTMLIGNVRKLQKLHDGVFPVQEVDVGRVLADIRSEYAAVSGKAITLSRNGCDRCIVHANELLHDVFSNLVNNAVKHTGGGTEIAIGLYLVDDDGARFCRVAVEDNGPGIPDDAKERIFNRMHKGSARGMGLGLYLVKSLVESYGGRVWAEDRVCGDHTQGARFVVMLPAVEK